MATKKIVKDEKPARNRLAEALLERAMALVEKKLWLRTEGEPAIKLFVPEAKLPVYATLTSDPPGLRLLLGRNAETYHAQLQSNEGVTPEFLEKLNLLGFSIDQLRKLPESARGILEDAEFKGAEDAAVPMFAAQFPGSPVRRPTRKEQRVILWAINMILAADSEEAFQPVEPSTGQILCLRAEGNAFELKAEASTSGL